MNTGAPVEAGSWPSSLEGVEGWLRGPEGRARLRGALDRHRLPAALADDLAQEVLYRAWRALGRGDEILSVPAFATVLLVRAARDLLRGAARRGELAEEPLPEDRDVDWAVAGEDPVAGAVVVALSAGRGADGVRRRVHVLLGPQPSCGAAALAFVVLVADDARLPTHCPVPGPGVDPDEALAWGALFYAGRDDCFEGLAGEATPAAVRARRSRALRAMRALLAQAATDLEDRDDA